MLPVNIHNGLWFDNFALQILNVTNLILQPKHFVTALILKTNNLIDVLTSLAVSTAIWVSKIKTANFVYNLNKNVSLPLAEQQIIDKKLNTKVNTLKNGFGYWTRGTKFKNTALSKMSYKFKIYLYDSFKIFIQLKCH